MNYLDELIYRYENGEINDEDVCDNITRITNKAEYYLDTKENRKKEKITLYKYGYIRLGKSPEDVIIEWEEKEKIFHFLTWLRAVLGEYDWYIFCQSEIYGKPKRQIAEEEGRCIGNIFRRLAKIKKYIKKALPLYYEQFGNLQEYLEG